MTDGSLRILDEMATRSNSRLTDGVVPGPHWTQDSECVSLASLLDDVPTLQVPISLTAQIYSSGMNVALRRWPSMETNTVSAPKPPTLLPAWKPTRPKVTTFGITFPEGASFLPVKMQPEMSRPKSVPWLKVRNCPRW